MTFADMMSFGIRPSAIGYILRTMSHHLLHLTSDLQRKHCRRSDHIRVDISKEMNSRAPASNNPDVHFYNNVYKRKQDHTSYDLKDDMVDRDLKYRIQNHSKPSV